MKSFRKFSQRKENRNYMNQEESVYELNRIQRYIMQMRPLLKKNALFSDGTADYRQPVEPDAGDEVTVRFRTARDNVDIVWLCTGDKKYKMKPLLCRDQNGVITLGWLPTQEDIFANDWVEQGWDFNSKRKR